MKKNGTPSFLCGKDKMVSTVYTLTYGNFALQSSIKIGSRTLASYGYSADGNHYLTSLDYGNGDSVDYSYDRYGRLKKETYEDSETVSYGYDNNGELATVRDSETDRENGYYYDLIGRLTKYTEKGAGHDYSVSYSYNTLNQLSKLVEQVNGTKRTTIYSYDDDNGNIIKISDGSNEITYAYDTANQLVRENHQEGGYSYVWTYDEAGNIKNRKEYAYTTEELGAVLDTISYSYGNSEWGDLLTK